jgi:peptidoglycan hydrolase CwlO-like protein
MFVFALLTAALAAEVGPIQKVIQLLDELQAKVISEGEGSQVQYEEFVDWCGKQASETKHSIADSTEQIDTLDATIETAKANIDELTAEIDGLTSSISRGEAELAAAKDQRATEHADFLSRDEHLGETVDMLTRAGAVLEKNLAAVKTEAVQGALVKLTSTLSAAVDAAFIALPDKQLVQSLLQKVDQQENKDDLDVSLLDVSQSQPQAGQVAYEGSGGAIVQTLEDLREKAESTRAASQKAEMEAAHAYNMFEQASETELKAQGEQLETAKKRMNKNDESKAAAEGEIETVKGAKATSEKYLKDTQQECMERASEWEAESAERSEELKTLAQAKKILSDQGVDQAEGRLAEVQVAGPASFLQLKVVAKAALPQRQVEAASYLRKEGQRIQSWVLSQVSDRLAADPFAKVKDMIQEMVEKLLQEQAQESEHKAWCDTEMAKTKSSLDVKTDRVEELKTRLEKTKAESAKLKREGADLMAEIQALDTAVKEATAMRQQEAESWAKKKKDYETGQQACAAAIKVLRQYYEGKSFVQTSAKASAKDPAGIVGLLEVAESDFSRMYAEGMASEDAAISEFETFTQDSKVSRAAKETEVKNKAAERQRIGNVISETTMDHDDSEKELAAVQEYDSKLKNSCETKTPTFEEREARRKQEIEGLQTALGILDGKDIALAQLTRGLRR